MILGRNVALTKFAKIYMEQMSDLFAEHHYCKFQNEIPFFLNTIVEHWNITIQVSFSCLVQFVTVSQCDKHHDWK